MSRQDLQEYSRQLDRTIQYHIDGLQMYRLQMSPAAQTIEDQTIRYLEELKEIKKE